MRVRTLDLARYGAFEDRSVEFGPGLTLVLGGNETGKSTTLDALADLLWSIPLHSSRSFRFSRQALVLRATLLLPDEAELRVERAAGGLSETSTGAAIAAVWQGDGDDRALWKTSFGLSHQALRDGGRDLCQARGDLASLIFQARSGHSVHSILEDLSARADALYKSHRNNKGVEARRALAEYQEAVAEAEGAMTRAHQVMEVRTAVERAAGVLDLRRAEAGRAKSEHHTWSAKLRVAGEIRDLARVRARAIELRAAGPCLTGDELETWVDATERLRSLDNDIAEGARRRDDVLKQSAAIVVEQDILAEQSSITLLARECAARIEDAAKADDALTEADRLDADARAQLFELTGVDLPVGDALSRLWLGADRVSELDAVALEIDEADSELTGSEKGLLDALDQEKTDSFGSATTSPESVAALREALAALKADDSAPTAFHEALRAAHQATTERAAFLGRAGLPVHTTIGAVPSVDAVKTAGDSLVAAEAAVRAKRADSTTAAQRLGDLERRFHKSGDVGVPDPAAVVDARAERDRRVDDVVRAWVTGVPASEAPDLPMVAERTIRRADHVADLVSEHREAAAARAVLLSQLAAARTEVDEAEAAVDTAVSALAEARRDWSAVWQPTGVVPPTPDEAVAHRALLMEVLAAEGKALSARELAEDLRPQAERQRAYLAEVLAQAGRPRPGADLDSLRTAAEEVLAEDSEARESRAVAARMRQLREKAQLAHDRARAVRDSADVRWKHLLSTVGLPEMLSTGWYRRRDVVTRAREIYLEAGRRREQALVLHERHAIFTRELNRVAALLDIEVAADPTETINGLHDRLLLAQRARTMSESFATQLADLKVESEKLSRQREFAVDSLAAMRQRFGSDDLDGAASRGRLLTGFEEQAAKHSGVIRAALPDLDLDQLVSDLAEADMESLGSELESAARLDNEADEAHQKAIEEHARLKDQYRDLTTRPGAAELHAKAEEKLAVLAERVEEYLAVEIQRTVLRAELEAYERKHASPLLDAAGRILEQLTGGRYVALRPQHDKDGRSLRIVGADEQAHVPDELSEGTADQAFLALRLAGIASLQESRVARGLPTLPVVLDDVLMTFDDARAAAAIRVMAELAEQWQIVVFSHHTHIREVAAGLGLDNVAVMELAGPAVLEPTREPEEVRAAVREGAVLDEIAQARPTRPTPAQDLTAVRSWARRNGFQVKERGRVPNEVINAYEAANT